MEVDGKGHGVGELEGSDTDCEGCLQTFSSYASLGPGPDHHGDLGF